MKIKEPGMLKKQTLFLITLLIFLPYLLAAQTVHVFDNENIPQRFFIGNSRIYFHSDSLYLNQQLLNRETDYSHDPDYNYFDLSKILLKRTDTLTIIYYHAPNWLKNKYGQGLPETKTDVNLIIPDYITSSNRNPIIKSPVKISGSKSFKVTSGGFGEAGFSQGLDLKLSGELTPGLEISGAVSDRQVNPAYNISNNSLSELDRINISLTSKHFKSQIGDIAQSNKNSSKSVYKKLSGITAGVNYSKWNLFATAARPRGVYQTNNISGLDGRQGPYQISSSTKINAVVPGSETVWLDGQLLSRGVGGDYQVDYTLGQISFNVNQPINSRSRIEIDYEPLENNFKKEFYHTGGGLTLFDSSLTIDLGWLYEGDDQGSFISEVYNDNDQNLLALVGDNLELAARSGVSPDTTGDYNLLLDSLPDSVFVYASDGLGDYKIIFSNVGWGEGAYNYLGGNRYLYVGTNLGNYSPLINIPAPSRQKFLLSKVSYKNKSLGDFDISINQSDYDQNLLSAIDDNNNRGEFYQVKYLNKWGNKSDSSYIGGWFYHKKYNYQQRERISLSDDRFRFFIPIQFIKQTDETRYELNSSIQLTEFFQLKPKYARLDYKNNFNSEIINLSSKLTPKKQIALTGGYSIIETEWIDNQQTKTAESKNINSQIIYQNSTGWRGVVALQKNKREHNYSDSLLGTRYTEINSSIKYLNHTIGYHYYTEDSLQPDWRESLTRQIYSISSEKNKGSFRYNSYLSINDVNAINQNQSFWLSRLRLNYYPLKDNLRISSSYQLSSESRQSRGVSYLEVAPGEGDYIFEDSLYIPDPDGNYVKIEELLSDQSQVDRLERNFSLTKNWSQLKLVLHSRVEEELLDDGERNLWWVVPFYVDESQPFFFYRRRLDGRLSLFPINNKDLILLEGLAEKELRTVASSTQTRENNKLSLTFRESFNIVDFFQTIEYFDEFRDSYYNRGTDINGLNLSVRSVVHFKFFELSSAVNYRRTKADEENKSDLYSISLGAIKRFKNKGEIRTSAEVYQQERNDSFSNLLFSDYKPGKQGMTWLVSIQYGFNKNMRLNLRVNGRHADDRSARITARSELIAGF